MTWQLACSAAAAWTALAVLGLAFFQGAKHASTQRYTAVPSRAAQRAHHLRLVS